MSRNRSWAVTGLIASGAGMGSTLTQIVERIALAENPQAHLTCNISKLISCTNVLLAPQSAVFRPVPNAAIAFGMFAIFFAAFSVAVSKSSISKWLARGMQGAMFFMLAFASWFMWQTAFSIGALCLYCTINTTAVVLVNLAWWKVTHRRVTYESLLAFGYWALLAALVFYGLWT